MEIKTISVMGCGWLGLPLAQALLQDGYTIKGSTTSPDKLETLEGQGIEPFLLSFPDNAPKTKLQEFLGADLLIFNLPPSRSSSEAISYEQVLQTVLKAAPTMLQAILFVSSTSVYPDLNREVTEQDAAASPDASSLMLRCEYLVQQHTDAKSTIVRFGGLMGGSRHPGRFLAGKQDVKGPDAPVNMIHLTDCIHLLREVISQDKWGFTFNACAPQHPSRKEFYTVAANQLHLAPPAFSSQDQSPFKIISPALLQKELEYSFQYPDPLSCLTSSDF